MGVDWDKSPEKHVEWNESGDLRPLRKDFDVFKVKGKEEALDILGHEQMFHIKVWFQPQNENGSNLISWKKFVNSNWYL